jgi:hypothetical protein
MSLIKNTFFTILLITSGWLLAAASPSPTLAQGTCHCYWTTILPSGYDCTDTGAAQQCSTSGGGAPQGCDSICPAGGCTGTQDERNRCLGEGGYSNPCSCETPPSGITCQQACDASYPGYTGLCETGSIYPHASAGDQWCGVPLSCFCIPPSSGAPNCSCEWNPNTLSCVSIDNCGTNLDPFGCQNLAYGNCQLSPCVCTNSLSPTPAITIPPLPCRQVIAPAPCPPASYPERCPSPQNWCCAASWQCALIALTPSPEAFDPCRHLSGSTYDSCNSCTQNGNAWTSLGCLPTSVPRGFGAWLLGRSIAIGGGIAFLLMIYAAFLIMTSQANPQKLQAGKELMTAAIVGLLMLVFSLFIIRFVIGTTLGLPVVG